VLFLDEPTIGLDVAMQRRIRSFVAEYNRRTGACVMLTSHYMADVEALCRRVIVIHQGRLLYDGNLTGLVQRFAAHKTITVELEEGTAAVTSLPAGLVDGAEVERTATGFAIRVPKAETPAVAGRLLAALPVTDLTIEEPPVDRVIEEVFAGPAADREDG
jgi:ABC-2 type transport system ATP-binding protein